MKLKTISLTISAIINTILTLMKNISQNHYHLKEKVKHGTPQLPISIHHLSYLPREEHYFPLHWHDEVEFTVVLCGAILYTLDYEEIILHAGEGLFVNANRVHSAKSFQNQSCETCTIVFHPLLLHQNLNSNSYSHFVYPILQNPKALPAKLNPCIPWQNKIISQLLSFDTLENDLLVESELVIKGMLYQIWDQLYKQVALNRENFLIHPQKYSYKIDRMKPVLTFIHTHYSEELTLKALASIIPMSKGQFCRNFKDIIGMTPMSYVIHYRIEESCTLLNDTSKKISDIARQVGFNTISYFNREFQKHLSCSPKEYRLKKF